MPSIKTIICPLKTSNWIQGVQALADAGFLQIAEDELEDGRGAPGVRLHFLAALQNMAACVDQSALVMASSTPFGWGLGG